MHPILDHDFISQRYFFPQRYPLPGATHVPISVGQLACWRSAPPGPRPVIVHFHGNGELVHHWIGELTPEFDAMGYDVFLAEYRGYGASDGTPRLRAMFDDLDLIADAIGVPMEQIVVFGRSVGSIYAIEWVNRFPKCAGLILESGIYDVGQRIRLRVTPEELGCTSQALDEAIDHDFNHGRKLRRYQGPSLILHAEQDHLVGVEHARINAHHHGDRAQLVTFERGDHNTILSVNRAAYFDAIRHFLPKFDRG